MLSEDKTIGREFWGTLGSIRYNRLNRLTEYMALLVQKYGGTSVGSVERIKSVAKRIAAAKGNGDDLTVVVSAMGHTTDELTALASAISKNPPHREMDMLLATGEQVTIALLSMALQEEGIPAESMTGAQVGIVTESAHGRARILEVRTERIQRRLLEGKVVVVAGFQGTSIGSAGTPEITTLGRVDQIHLLLHWRLHLVLMLRNLY